MFVKSSTVRCLSNAVVKVFRNSCERNLKCDQVDPGWYFRKKYYNSDERCSHPVCSLTVGSKRKIKMKTQNIMTSSYRLNVSSTQNKGVPFFSCLNHGV